MRGAATREIGGYEILARLKSGGMATLYLGRRVGTSGFSRHVAIKFIHEHLAEDQDFVRMFVNEALLQARISHPNVVHVEELGERDGQQFLVMEYVHGCALSQLLRTLARKDRGLPLELAVFIAMQVAAGLHAAHELRDETGNPLGVVHRDVSPDNVLLAYEGHVKLIDFGVAKVQARAVQTSTGLLKGKLRYMSPEQANGEEIDRRTDVYALAVVLWEMLTMRRLFPISDQLKLLDAVRNPQIPEPSAVRPGIPPALEAVVMRALRIDREERFATTHDFRRALAEALPTAALTDSSQLAELIGFAMSAEIESDQKKMPASVSAVFTSAPRVSLTPGEAEQALATRTISVRGLGYLSESGVAALGAATPAPIKPPSASLAGVIAPPGEPLVQRTEPSTSGVVPTVGSALAAPPLRQPPLEHSPLPQPPPRQPPLQHSPQLHGLQEPVLQEPSFTASTPGPDRGRLVLVGGALLLLVAVLGGGVAYLVSTRSAGPGVTVTSLAPASPGTAASPTPAATNAPPTPPAPILATPTPATPTPATPATPIPTVVVTPVPEASTTPPPSGGERAHEVPSVRTVPAVASPTARPTSGAQEPRARPPATRPRERAPRDHAPLATEF